MHMRLVHLWSARALQAVLRRLSSDMQPRCAAYFTCHRMTWWSPDTVRDPVRSKYSCGLMVVVPEEPTKPLSALDHPFRIGRGLS